MKINNKILDLIGKGMKANTLRKLNESQINVLHSKLIKEQPQPQVVQKSVKQIVLPTGAQTTVGGVSVSNAGGKTTITPTTEEIQEDDLDVDVSKDPDATADGMGIFEKELDEKNADKNPWAICTAQLGKEFKTTERSQWSAKQKNKYERCVKDVKKSLKEGKNPVSLFLENEIMKIVEKNIPPRITKGDLIKYMTEQKTAPAKPATKPTTKPGKPETKPRPKHPGKNPNPGENPAPKAKKEVEEQKTAPAKPATKPTTKPGKPATRPRPQHPGKNPNPGENPAPKAKKVSPSQAKDKVIDLIMNLLQK